MSDLDDDETRAAEAAALLRLFAAQPLSQAVFGRRFGIGGQSMVSQYLKGRCPLNLAAAINFARGLGVSVDAFSPRLAALAVAGSSGSTQAPAQPAAAALSLGPTALQIAELADKLSPYQQDQLIAAVEAMSGPAGDRITLSLSIAPRAAAPTATPAPTRQKPVV